MKVTVLFEKTAGESESLKSHLGAFFGNNASFVCPGCGSIFIVSTVSAGKVSECQCGQSTAEYFGEEKAQMTWSPPPKNKK